MISSKEMEREFEALAKADSFLKKKKEQKKDQIDQK